MYILIRSERAPSRPKTTNITRLYIIKPIVTVKAPLITAEKNFERAYVSLPVLVMMNLIFPLSLSAQNSVTKGIEESTGKKSVR